MVACGHKLQIRGAMSGLTWLVVYESEDDVSTDDLEAWVEANDGRVGFITGTADTEKV